ncbi:hypothetical protein CJD44_02170 [Streptomyces sp. alain-838]|nr:hypothetical protein CJD44_02170 [Streptomyces sp. alain-838]
MCHLWGTGETACSAAVRDPTRNPRRAAGEATEIRVRVHPPVASFRKSWICFHRKLVGGVTGVKR